MSLDKKSKTELIEMIGQLQSSDAAKAVTELQSANDTLSEQNTTLKSEVERLPALEQEKNALQEKVEQLEAANIQLTEQSTELQGMITELNNRLSLQDQAKGNQIPAHYGSDRSVQVKHAVNIHGRNYTPAEIAADPALIDHLVKTGSSAIKVFHN